jgi:DNA-binding SARP family transcriptional activator
LFTQALQSDIEADLVRELIVRWTVPAPADAPAEWPWPLSVQTLGQFAVKLGSKPIEFGHKAPRKTLALLKALIGLGGTDVPEQTLTDALWPDEEGDAAHAAYTMTLSRLRKLLGDASLLQQRGAKLSLDRRKCWVDAWAFERSIAELDDGGAAGEALPSRLFPALKLYGGNFLPEDSDAPWTASLRERLRSRFVRTVSEAALALEHAGKHEQAAKLYQHGLDADNMAEAFYQGLMRCHAAAGRPTDAIATYQRLRQLLSVTLSVKPSAATERLYQSLRGG